MSSEKGKRSFVVDLEADDDDLETAKIAKQMDRRKKFRSDDESASSSSKPAKVKIRPTERELEEASPYMRRAHGFVIDLCRMSRDEAEKMYAYVRQEGTAKPSVGDYADAKKSAKGKEVEVSWPLYREIPWDRYDVPDKFKRTQGATSAKTKKKIGGISMPWALALRLFGRFASEAPSFCSPFRANPSTFKFDEACNVLFPHQVEASREVLSCLATKKSCFLSLPCGKGKTATALYIASEAMRQLDPSSRPPKVAVCVGTDRILYQWVGVSDDECDLKGIAKFVPAARVKIVKGGSSYDVSDCDVAVVSIKTLTSWLSDKNDAGPERRDRLRKEAAWVKQKASRKKEPSKRVIESDLAKEKEFARRRKEEEESIARADPSQPYADSAFFGQFSMVVFDEAHHMPASTFASIVTAFDAEYLLGLTATVFREDGLTKALHDQLGPTAYLMKDDPSQNELIIRSLRVRCRIELPYFVTRCSHRTQEVYLKTAVAECSELNAIKARVILWLFDQGRYVFAVTDRKCQIFSRELCEEAGILTKTKEGKVVVQDLLDDEEEAARALDEEEAANAFVRGGLNKGNAIESARGTVFLEGSVPAHLEKMAPGFVKKHCALMVGSMKPEAQIRALKKRVVFGTYPIIEEALDDPKRETMIELMSRNGTKSIVQRIGRITRYHPNKEKVKPCLVTFRHETPRLAEKDESRHRKYAKVGYEDRIRKQDWADVHARVPLCKLPRLDFLDESQ